MHQHLHMCVPGCCAMLMTCREATRPVVRCAVGLLGLGGLLCCFVGVRYITSTAEAGGDADVASPQLCSQSSASQTCDRL